MIKKLLLLLSISLLASCATQRFAMNENYGDEKVKVTQNFWFLGLSQEDSIDVTKVCKKHYDVSVIDFYITAPQALVTLLTLGVYAPRSANVYCLREN